MRCSCAWQCACIASLLRCTEQQPLLCLAYSTSHTLSHLHADSHHNTHAHTGCMPSRCRTCCSQTRRSSPPATAARSSAGRAPAHRRRCERAAGGRRVALRLVGRIHLGRLKNWKPKKPFVIRSPRITCSVRLQRAAGQREAPARQRRCRSCRPHSWPIRDVVYAYDLLYPTGVLGRAQQRPGSSKVGFELQRPPRCCWHLRALQALALGDSKSDTPADQG